MSKANTTRNGERGRPGRSIRRPAGRPPKKPTLNVAIPRALPARGSAFCKADHRSLTYFVETALEDRLAARQTNASV